jgi:hypothetical protein
MGADTFTQFHPGEQPSQDAFRQARDQARYDHGHAGYSGTLAEKDSCVVINEEGLSMQDAVDRAEELVSMEDPRINDKWGPAGAIRISDGKDQGWLFFGWASS